MSEFRSCRPHLGVPTLVAVCAWLRLITALILFLIRPYHVCVIGRNKHDSLPAERVQDCVLAFSTCPERRIPKLLCIRLSTSSSLSLSMQLLVWTSMTLVVYPPRVSGGRHCSFMLYHSSRCGGDDNRLGFSQPTVVVADVPMVERFSLSFLLMAKISKEGTRIKVSEFCDPPIQRQRR